jgi:hypothetical protein
MAKVNIFMKVVLYIMEALISVRSMAMECLSFQTELDLKAFGIITISKALCESTTIMVITMRVTFICPKNQERELTNGVNNSKMEVLNIRVSSGKTILKVLQW